MRWGEYEDIDVGVYSNVDMMQFGGFFCTYHCFFGPFFLPLVTVPLLLTLIHTGTVDSTLFVHTGTVDSILYSFLAHSDSFILAFTDRMYYIILFDSISANITHSFC